MMTKRLKYVSILQLSEKTPGLLLNACCPIILAGSSPRSCSRSASIKIEIHFDFLDGYKCIGIQGKYKQNFVDIQIEKTAFSIGCDPIEPDEYDYHPLENEELFYAAITQKLSES